MDNDNPSKRNIKILDVERLRLMASQGYTLKHASKVMMCSPSKIYQCAKQNGIQFKIGGRSVDGMKIPAMTAEQRREYNRSKARTHTCADCQIKIYPNGRRCVRCALIHRHKTQPESFRGSSMKSALAVTSQLEEQAGLDPV